MPDKGETVFRTPNLECPCCAGNLLHTAAAWKLYHPFAGHGMTREHGWSHPDLVVERV